MKLTCTSAHLKSAIGIAERFTSKHVTLPILAHILLNAKDKKISLTATNLEVGVEYTLPGKVQKIGEVTIPARPLAQLLQSLSNDETITLESQGHQLTLHTPTSDITLLGLDPKNFPTLPTIEREHSFSVTTLAIAGALQQVLPAAATVDFRPELAGILMVVRPGSLTLAATDSFRLAEKTVTNGQRGAESLECIVPARAAHEMLRSLPEGDELAVTVGENQIFFECGGVRILSRLIDGAYPPYKNLLPKAYESTLVVEREDLLRKIRLAAVFASRLNDVTLSYSPTELLVMTTNHETGATTSRLAAKGRGVSGSAVFNYRYLLDGLEAADGEHVTLNLNGVSGPTLIQNPTDTSFLYLLMPIRSV